MTRITWTPDRIRERRERKGLSVAQLAIMLGVSRMTIYRWEDGRVQPRLPVVEELAATLGVSPSHFWAKEVESETRPDKNRATNEV